MTGSDDDDIVLFGEGHRYYFILLDRKSAAA
jgi:hypothetical protein